MKEIEQLIEVSRRYGADSRFVIAGGGNTSFKTADRLWVKASGHALATIGEDGFAVLDRAKLNPMGTKAYSADTAEREAQVKDDLAAACITKDRRPSVETSMHNAISYARNCSPMRSISPTAIPVIPFSRRFMTRSRHIRLPAELNLRSSSCRITAFSLRPIPLLKSTGYTMQLSVPWRQ